MITVTPKDRQTKILKTADERLKFLMGLVKNNSDLSTKGFRWIDAKGATHTVARPAGRNSFAAYDLIHLQQKKWNTIFGNPALDTLEKEYPAIAKNAKDYLQANGEAEPCYAPVERGEVPIKVATLIADAFTIPPLKQNVVKLDKAKAVHRTLDDRLKFLQSFATTDEMQSKGYQYTKGEEVFRVTKRKDDTSARLADLVLISQKDWNAIFGNPALDKLKADYPALCKKIEARIAGTEPGGYYDEVERGEFPAEVATLIADAFDLDALKQSVVKLKPADKVYIEKKDRLEFLASLESKEAVKSKGYEIEKGGKVYRITQKSDGTPLHLEDLANLSRTEWDALFGNPAREQLKRENPDIAEKIEAFLKGEDRQLRFDRAFETADHDLVKRMSDAYGVKQCGYGRDAKGRYTTFVRS